MYTRRGYAAVVRVARGSLVHMMYVSAASLATPLEKSCSDRGKLDGVRIRVRKTSEERMATYEVEVLP